MTSSQPCGQLRTNGRIENIPGKSGKFGFTLIELLVIIAIIAILAAILFPVFASAREKARQTNCLSNVKQLALGGTMYLQDYDERFMDYYIEQHGALWNVAFEVYIKNKQVHLCPDAMKHD